MTMAMGAAPTPTGIPRALRVAIVRRGKIIDERIFRKPERIRVGRAEGSDLMLEASSGVPSFTLFEREGDELFLCLRGDMRGRVGGRTGSVGLDELRRSGRTREGGGVERLRLGSHSRGKLVLGETTLLFQMVVPPPITPRPALPASARGGFVAAIDWLFTAFVVCAYAGFFGGIVYLENADWPLASALQNLSPDAVAEMIFSEPEPPPAPPPQVSADPIPPVATPAPTPERHARNAPRPPTPRAPSPRAAPTAEARARIAAEASARAEMLLLGALGQGGALADSLRGGALTQDAEEVFAQVEGVRVARRARADVLQRRRGGGPTGIGFHRASGADIADEGPEVTEVAVMGRVRVASGGGDTGGAGDMPQDVVTGTIRQRVRAIRRCYERLLARRPNLAGKVTIAFTVTETGTVAHARAIENTSDDPMLGECVAATLGRMRFRPGPEGGSVDFRYPFVFAPQR